MRYNLFTITYAMCSISIFTSIMKIIYHFTAFSIFSIFIVILFFANLTDICIFMISAVHLLITLFFFFFLKLIVFIVCSPKNSLNFFMQSLPLYTSYSVLLMILSTLKNLMEYIFTYFYCRWIFRVNFHPSIFNVKDSRSAKLVNGALTGLWYWLNSNVLEQPLAMSLAISEATAAVYWQKNSWCQFCMAQRHFISTQWSFGWSISLM